MTEAADAQRPSGYSKSFYKVGEVAELTGLHGHVLRYWESEFTELRPRKSRGGQRLYSPADIEVILRIRDLLHVRGFTIAGARRALAAEGTDAAGSEGPSAAELLDEARREVEAILTMMGANDKR